MGNNNGVELKNLVLVDTLAELLRSGAKRLIAEAIESELEIFLTEVSHLSRWKIMCCAEWLFARARNQNGYWSSQSTGAACARSRRGSIKNPV